MQICANITILTTTNGKNLIQLWREKNLVRHFWSTMPSTTTYGNRTRELGKKGLGLKRASPTMPRTPGLEKKQFRTKTSFKFLCCDTCSTNLGRVWTCGSQWCVCVCVWRIREVRERDIERERERGNGRSVEHNWVRHVNTKNCNKHDSEATRTEMIFDRVSTKQELKKLNTVQKDYS